MSGVDGSNPEIFLVDDDPTARESIAALLAAPALAGARHRDVKIAHRRDR
jgi:FixJ family two-component response regulator